MAEMPRPPRPDDARSAPPADAADPDSAQSAQPQSAQPQSDPVPSAAEPTPNIPHSSSIEIVLSRRPDQPDVTTGALAAELVRTHEGYIDEGIGLDSLVPLGVTDDVAALVERAKLRWDATRVPLFTARHLILALALEPTVGWELLRLGVIASMLDRWIPGLGTAEEPHRLVWDVLSDAGRAEADDHPLFAAACGAPPQWTADLPADTSPLSPDITQLVWSPDGVQLAALVGEQVYTMSRTRSPEALGPAGTEVTSLGWSDQGVVAMRVTGTIAEVRQISTQATLATASGVDAGKLSGNGSTAWLSNPSELMRWRIGGQQAPIGPPSTAVSLGYDGASGLISRGTTDLVVAVGPIPAMAVPAPDQPEWRANDSHVTGWITLGAGSTSCLASVDKRPAVVEANASSGVHVRAAPGVDLARLPVGPNVVTALAADRPGTTVAVAQGTRISVWPLRKSRGADVTVPRYDSDRSAGNDLLDSDRTARALAALIASEELRPPLTIGLFGAWGAGKSFVLEQLSRHISLFQSNRPGYLANITTVRFNAWEYAEANLWASLVNRVLTEIGATPQPPTERADVRTAQTELSQAEAKVADIKKAITQEDAHLSEARGRLIVRRRRARLLTWLIVLFAAIALTAVVFILALPDRWVPEIATVIARGSAVVSASLGLIATVYAAWQQVVVARKQSSELVDAGKDGVGALRRAIGATEVAEIASATQAKAELTEHLAAAEALVTRRKQASERLGWMAGNEPLALLLNDLANVTEFRDQLSIVARSRRLFDQIDRTIKEQRVKAGSMRVTTPGPPSGDQAAPTNEVHAGAPDPVITEFPRLDRVVVIIDDLDRCPQEKVVEVLEAVHLLFEFEMFVVILAVDTRWLEQSLRIRYRHLLGEDHTATPLDYLEKIIQVPVQLRPLDPGMVERMIGGLTRATQTSTGDDPGAWMPEKIQYQSSDPTRAALLLTPEHGRPVRPELPAEVLAISPEEVRALSSVARFVGTTPRTVKRFVNTYQLIKASSEDPTVFLDQQDPAASVVAFLLAVLMSRPTLAEHITAALADEANRTLKDAVSAVANRPDATPEIAAGAKELLTWLTQQSALAAVPASVADAWAEDVGRYSFTPVGK